MGMPLPRPITPKILFLEKRPRYPVAIFGGLWILLGADCNTEDCAIVLASSAIVLAQLCLSCRNICIYIRSVISHAEATPSALLSEQDVDEVVGRKVQREGVFSKRQSYRRKRSWYWWRSQAWSRSCVRRLAAAEAFSATRLFILAEATPTWLGCDSDSTFSLRQSYDARVV